MRTIFLVDGFNVYHSAVDIERDLGLRVKWLDYASLFSSYLHLLGKAATLESIYYFTALAHHFRNPDAVKRHETYIRCLRAIGVKDYLGRFKAKSPVQCPKCGNLIHRHEEKETDVAIAAKMFEVFINGACDCVVLVSGDTDLVPAVMTANRLFPHKKTVFAFPYRRMNAELAQLAPGSFKMNGANYAKHQLPDPFILPDGTTISKPPTW